MQNNCTNYADFFADEDTLNAKMDELKLSEEDATTAAGDSSQPIMKLMPGGKVKRAPQKEVVLERNVRNKKKCVTTVKGLDLFGVKLSDAAKKFGKKFACGASVVKDATGKEEIDVQGDFSQELAAFIMKTYPDIQKGHFYSAEKGKKAPLFWELASKKKVFPKPCPHPNCTRPYVALVTRVIPCQFATSSCSSVACPCREMVSMCQSATHGVSFRYTLSVDCSLSHNTLWWPVKVPLHL